MPHNLCPVCFSKMQLFCFHGQPAHSLGRFVYKFYVRFEGKVESLNKVYSMCNNRRACNDKTGAFEYGHYMSCICKSSEHYSNFMIIA